MCGYFGKIVQRRFFWPDDIVAEIWILRNGHPSENEGENSNVWKEGRGDQVLPYELRLSVWIFIVSAVRCHWRILNVVSKITADGDWSHEIKRHLLLERKAMTNLDSIWKSRDITFPTKFCLVKAKVFPVVVYECKSWTIKKVECWRIDAFELWCWRRLLRVPWPTRRSNQSILKEISPEYSLEGLMLKLKLQLFVYLMRRTDSFEKTLMLGKIEVRRRRRQQRMRWLSFWQRHHWLYCHEFE